MTTCKPLVISDLKPALNPVLVTDTRGLDAIGGFFETCFEFGMDTETNVVPKFTQRKMRTIQVGNRDIQYVIDVLAFAGSTADLIAGQGKRQTSSWAEPIVRALRPGFDSRHHVKVGANLQFDYETLLWCLGLPSWNFYDVQLAEKVLWAGRVNLFAKGFWALDDLVARYCLLQISKEEQKSFDLETPLTQKQIDYGALDTRLPLAVKAGQLKKIEAAQLTSTVKIENEAIPTFGDMHVNGVKLDRGRWEALVAANEEKHKANVKRLDTFFVPVVGAKAAADKWSDEAIASLEEVCVYEEQRDGKPDDESPRSLADLSELECAWRTEIETEARILAREAYRDASRENKEDDHARLIKARATLRKAKSEKNAFIKDSKAWEGDAAINYGSSPQLMAAMRTMGFNATVLPNTNDKTLAKMSEKPVIQALQDFRETGKLLTTYGPKWLENINDVTDRVHSRVNQIGADSGRTSSVDPNTQNLPKLKAYRACFVARPGYKMVGVDMAGCQLRIMAEDAGDELWITAFENDWDVHSIGAEMAEPDKWASCALDGCAFTSKKGKCKCPGHNKLRDDNKSTNFGVAFGMEEFALAAKLKISKDEAGKKLAKWRVVNKGVHERLVKSGEEGKLNFAIRTLGGRRRLFDKPDWKRAGEIALQRSIEDAVKKEAVIAKKEGRKPRPADTLPRKAIDSKAVGRVYYAMFGSIERESKNTRIQGTEADIAKVAMGAGFDEDGKPFMCHLFQKYGVEIVLMVHDEVVCEVPEENAEAWGKEVQDCFLRAGKVFMKRVKMLSDVHGGDCWVK